jgi:hypothetical protein
VESVTVDPIPPERVFAALKAHHAKGLELLRPSKMDLRAYDDWRGMMAYYAKAWPDAPTRWLRRLQGLDRSLVPSVQGDLVQDRRDRLSAWLDTLKRAIDELALRFDDALGRLTILIAHDGKTAARDKLEAFIRALGANPIIVEAEPSLGASVYAKVEAAIPLCQYGVVLSTRARAAIQDGYAIPRGNLIDEAARLRGVLGRARVLLMVEQDVYLPSNIADFITAGFTAQSMDAAFTELVNELRGQGMLNLGVPRR